MSQHLSDPRRNQLITASNAWGAVYQRQKLWRQMTLREPPFEGNEATEYGNIYEPIALSALERELNEIVDAGNKFMVHNTLPFGASPDFFWENMVGEIKCPFTQIIYEEIPERYYFQMQMQMEVCNKEACLFYIWTPEKTKQEIVKKDDKWLEWYQPLALEFLKYIEDDVEPVRWKRKPIYNKE